MSVDQRSTIKDTLLPYFSDAKNIEDSIFKMCERISENYGDGIEDIYSKFAYEKVGELITLKSSLSTNEILEDISKDVYNWESSVYNTYREKENRGNIDQVTGPKVVSGEFKCKSVKCRSDKCLYWQMQTRGCDEPPTTYVVCSECGFRYSFG
jgi:DNA-directed RNA polymerase subunit M/transcription elongation factor TFIIS